MKQSQANKQKDINTHKQQTHINTISKPHTQTSQNTQTQYKRTQHTSNTNHTHQHKTQNKTQATT